MAGFYLARGLPNLEILERCLSARVLRVVVQEVLCVLQWVAEQAGQAATWSSLLEGAQSRQAGISKLIQGKVQQQAVVQYCSSVPTVDCVGRVVD